MWNTLQFAGASALCGLAVASPLDSEKRANVTCAPQPRGNGPQSSPDTPAGFLDDQLLHKIASTAVAPNNYFLAFQDNTASVQENGYITYETLTNYDAQLCGAICDKTKNCVAFNIYFERDPSLDPGKACPNPSSTNNIKCALYSQPVYPSTATNFGQFREEFQIVIAGSNGYNKQLNNHDPSVPSIKDYDGGTGCGVHVLNITSARINSQFFSGGDVAENIQKCANSCTYITTNNEEGAYLAGKDSWVACNMFDTYVQYKNGRYDGVGCVFYSKPWDPYYCFEEGSKKVGSDVYEYSFSSLYTLDPQNRQQR